MDAQAHPLMLNIRLVLCCKSSMALLMAQRNLVSPTQYDDVFKLFSVVCDEPNAIM